ncbi:hypothetical protein [Rhodoligotrophos defluvii]|uniref:hypothetical protein n=1 Tax=Rhodoligotrophos defluvii TaxID=2561934 RepID=UPI0010C9A61A|nr:hypothetical protein [Rhodoligotrophos defluvii]
MAARSLKRNAKAVVYAALGALLPGIVFAQGIEESATDTAPQSSSQDGGTNQYGWPNDYVAQVGAGVTNAITTGYSGIKETQSGSSEVSLPELPSAKLCSEWEGTDAHAFCMEKLVQE